MHRTASFKCFVVYARAEGFHRCTCRSGYACRQRSSRWGVSNPGGHITGWTCVVIDEYSPLVDRILCSQPSFLRQSIRWRMVTSVVQMSCAPHRREIVFGQKNQLKVVMRVTQMEPGVCKPSTTGGIILVVRDGSILETHRTLTSQCSLGWRPGTREPMGVALLSACRRVQV